LLIDILNTFCILYYLRITVYVFFIVYVTLPPGIGPIAVGNKYKGTKDIREDYNVNNGS
jgi:hypothetical protein